MHLASIIVAATVTAAVVSVICCNISAKITFQVIDKYVADIIETAKEAIWDARVNK